jgi:acetyl esterase/lipase
MKTLNQRLFALSFILLVAASPAAVVIAQDQKPSDQAGQVKSWMQSDSNQDGKISKDEADGQQKRFFDRNDLNNDGFLDSDELNTLARRLADGRANQNRDTNRNPNESAVTATTQLRARIPDGVTLVPDIPYREGHPRWKLDLLMPIDRGAEPRPAIVFVHGGGWRSGDKRAASFINPAIDFAAKGYVCITVNYRFVTDVSMMDTIADVKCAVRWLRAHANQYNVDPDRFGAYGNSAGAHLVSMLGLCPTSAGMEGDGPWQDQSSMVQAVCASATPTSFLIPMNNRVRDQNQNRQRGGAEANSLIALSQEMRRKISPILYANADAPPFLLIHDESDQTVLSKR